MDDLKGIDLVSLCEALCECVQVEGSPDHHDLALMEGVLKSMLNVTSRYIYISVTEFLVENLT